MSAAPKIGKSWLVLSLGLCCGYGYAIPRRARGPGPVLCLALEDGKRRLQERMRRILDGQPAPEALVLRTDSLDAVDAAKQFATDHRGSNPLIIVDTLARIRPPRLRGADIYREDYQFARSLKDNADLGATVLGVHHTRKAESEDFLESASGTNGLTGAADFVMVLQRRRTENNVLLKITGRDVAEASTTCCSMTDCGAPTELDLTTLPSKRRCHVSAPRCKALWGWSIHEQLPRQRTCPTSSASRSPLLADTCVGWPMSTD